MTKIFTVETVPKKLINKPMCLNVAGIRKNRPHETALYTDGDNIASVTRKGGESTVCFCAENIGFVREIIGKLSGYVTFSGVSPEIFLFLKSNYRLLWSNDCGLYVYDGKPLTHICENSLYNMEARYAPDIAAGTPYDPDLEEICECLEKLPSSAVYADNMPVCWCIMHIENSLGMLYTRPEYRRRGYALDVMTDITRKVIQKGETPYAYIIKGNTASESLAPKYNLPYVCDAHWCGITVEEK